MAGVQRTRKPTTTQLVKPPRKFSGAKAKPPASKTAVAPDPRPVRKIRPRTYKAFRFSKRIKHEVRLPSALRLTRQARQLVAANRKLLGGIVLVYGVLNMVLVHGLNGGTDVSQLKQHLDQLFQGTFGNFTAGIGVFALLVGTSASGSANTSAPVYQAILALVVSLALIWTYRQRMAGKLVGIRDAYYRGMYPIIPVLLVLLVIGLQLLPLMGGAWLFTTVVQNGIAINGIERFLWGLIFLLLALLSLYMICSSFFAIYIVCLPEMTPLKALRSARELVRYRRWSVLRKALFLPLWLFVVGSLIMLPIIFLLPVIAQWVFYLLMMVGLAVGHAYLYLLYRELLREKN